MMTAGKPRLSGNFSLRSSRASRDSVPLGRNSEASLVETSSMLGEIAEMPPAMMTHATITIATPRHEATLAEMTLNNAYPSFLRPILGLLNN